MRHATLARAIFFATLLFCGTAFGGLAFMLDRIETRLQLATTEAINSSTASLSERIGNLGSSVEHLADEVRISAPADLGHKHTDIRKFVIVGKLAQVQRPIVVIGDSITETAMLPPAVCGHPVVNAGIGGASSRSYLPIAKEVLGNVEPALIVVALGTNDAQLAARTAPPFAISYARLIDYVKTRTRALVLVGVPPLEISKPLAQGYFDEAASARDNAAIEAVAAASSVQFADVRQAMSGNDLTVDGVHLTPAGYRKWMQPITDAITRALGCSSGNANAYQ